MDHGASGTAATAAVRPPGHLVIAGGGTGGHVFPGLAVAEVLAERGWTVSWIGRPEGLERRLVGERGLPYDAVPARAMVGRGPLGRLRALATTARSALAASRRLAGRRAAAVLGTGGYVGAPAVLGAWLTRRPVVLLEPNARAGAANRWLSRCAAAAAVAWPETAAGLSCPVRVTGVPVRRAFFDLPATVEGERLRLLVLGGSQGSRELNRLVPQALARLRPGLPPLSVRHQCGTEHVAETEREWAGVADPGRPVEVVPFIADVPAAIAAADLVVSRAGAVTLAEVCAAGRPAVLLPLALAGGHQGENARQLAAADAAIALAAPAVEELAAALAALLADRPRRRAMGRAARSLARPDAAAAIADLVLEVAG